MTLRDPMRAKMHSERTRRTAKVRRFTLRFCDCDTVEFIGSTLSHSHSLSLFDIFREFGSIKIEFIRQHESLQDARRQVIGTCCPHVSCALLMFTYFTCKKLFSSFWTHIFDHGNQTSDCFQNRIKMKSLFLSISPFLLVT